MNSKTNNGKLAGPAMQALRAFMHAISVEKGERNKERFRYEIAADRSEARIYDTTIPAQPTEGGDGKWKESADNQVVAGYQRSLEEFARLGKQARLGFIGLIDTKKALEEKSGKADTSYVRYTLNALTGEAFLDRNGTRITTLPAATKESPEATIEAPTTIEGWAKLGRKVEQAHFDELKVIVEYYGKDSEQAENCRKRMEERRIIRPRRPETK